MHIVYDFKSKIKEPNSFFVWVYCLKLYLSESCCIFPRIFELCLLFLETIVKILLKDFNNLMLFCRYTLADSARVNSAKTACH